MAGVGRRGRATYVVGQHGQLVVTSLVDRNSVQVF